MNNILAPVDAQIDAYEGQFRDLQKKLSDYAIIDCASNIYRVLDVVQGVSEKMEDHGEYTILPRLL